VIPRECFFGPYYHQTVSPPRQVDVGSLAPVWLPGVHDSAGNRFFGIEFESTFVRPRRTFLAT